MHDIEKKNQVLKKNNSISHLSQPKKSVSPKMCLIQFNRVLTREIFNVSCISQNKRPSQNIKLHFLPLFKIMGAGTMQLSMTITGIWTRAVRTGVTLTVTKLYLQNNPAEKM